MYPHDLEPERLRLPEGDRRSAVLISGGRPRHLRLGYHLQRRFPGLLQRWCVVAPSRSATWSAKLDKARRLALAHPAVSSARERIEAGGWPEVLELGRTVGRRLRREHAERFVQAVRAYGLQRSYDTVEDDMFRREVDALAKTAELHPTRIDSPNDDALVAELEAASPYFLLAFGGPLLRGRVLRCARGLAINQHAGWSPALKGASTVEMAVYHRQIGWIGNTVHVMDTFADAGGILRRSTATLHPDDELAHCVMAVVAVGTKMMLEVVGEALCRGEVTVFPQPHGGATINGIDFDPARRMAVARDIAGGWIGEALRATRSY